MAPSDILAQLRARPDVPFRIVTSDGIAYEIRHPELCMPGLASVIIGHPAPGLPGAYERYDIVSMRHVVRLEVSHPVGQPDQGGNGPAQP